MGQPLFAFTTALPSAESAATARLYWALPRVALVLFFSALAALLWFLHRSEIEEQRANLISDVLWAEQDLRFQITRMEESLQRLATDLTTEALNEKTFAARVRHHLATTPWLTRVVLVDAAGTPRQSLPPVGGAEDGEGAAVRPSSETMRMALSLSKAAYSHPYSVNRETLVEVHVPIFRDTEFAGAVVGFLSLGSLLQQEIPWWFAQKYLVTIEDVNGSVLASKSSITAGRVDLTYQVAFDPPGRGLMLRVTSYEPDKGFVRSVLGTAIVLLALTVLWSLWALRRHVQRRYAAEQALREEHVFRTAMENSLLTGLRARDLAGRITYVNPAFCRMVGFPESELIGRGPPMPYWAPEEMERTRAVHDGILAGAASHEGVEVRLMRKSGERFDALIYEAPLIDSAGRHTGWMGSMLDITARKRAEELYRQQQEKLQFTARLVTMGEMASTLAHELNQPLSAIASYNTGCLNKLEAGDFPREDLSRVLRKIGAQAQRAGAIIRRVHEFVRRSEPKLTACDLRPIIEDSIALVEGEARKRGVRIVADLTAEPLPVLADRVMIEQVLLNLMRNGMDAMGDTAPEDKHLRVRAARGSTTIVVAVADHGCGIPAAVAERLYTPFFTTKVEGMGMGLNICRSIMELHKGRLWFEPDAEGGTVFWFSLPVSQP